MTDAEALIRKVGDMLHRVENELFVHIAHLDDVFWQVQAIIRENPVLASGGTFQDWIAQCYTDSVTAGVRRPADERRDAVSLWRVLEGMVKIAPLLTRARFVSLHDPACLADARASWQELVGASEALSKKLVRAKQQELEAALKRVATFADENVAHLSVQPTNAETTFPDVRLALAAAFRVYRWCCRILTGRAYSSPVLIDPEPWLRVFRVPWIQPEKGIPKYRSLDEFIADRKNAQPSNEALQRNGCAGR